MATLCSQCGAQVPRPDVSRAPIVCARCATVRTTVDDEDMPTVDQPPPRLDKPATARAPIPSVPPRPSVPAPRPSTRPPVGGPPGSRIRAGESPVSRATPSVAPRPMTSPPPSSAAAPRPSGSPPRPSAFPSATRVPAAAPVPRAVPKPEPAKLGRAIPVGEEADTNEFSPLESGDFDEATGDINLATGDFESIGPKKPGPPRP